MLTMALNLLFNNPIAKIGASVVALLSLVGLYSCEQRRVGASQERVKIERKANENVVKAADVRSASERGDAGRVRDPYAAGR